MSMYVGGCSLPIIACMHAALNQKRNLSNNIHLYMYQLFDVWNISTQAIVLELRLRKKTKNKESTKLTFWFSTFLMLSNVGGPLEIVLKIE